MNSNNMILIEEDDEKVGEESCSEPNEETAHKENKSINNKGQRTKAISNEVGSDNFQKPRAMNNQKQKEHGIKFEVHDDERVINHLQQEPKEALSLMFYDFNNCTGSNPYQN